MKTIQRTKSLIIILAATMSNMLAASTTVRPTGLELWLDYEHYAKKPNYLTIMGFTNKANCSISLMRSNSAPRMGNAAAFLSFSKESDQRSEIFKNVINAGLEITNQNETLRDLSDTERREMVFLKIAQHDAILKNLVNIAVNSDQQLTTKQEATAKTFSIYYENNNCESILGYRIKSSE